MPKSVLSPFSEGQDRRKGLPGWLQGHWGFAPLLHLAPQHRDERVPQHLLRCRQVRPCSRQSEFEHAELILWFVSGHGLCVEMVKCPRHGLKEVRIKEYLKQGAAFRSGPRVPLFHRDKTWRGLCHIV